jgi:hypothetical protein
VQQPHGFARNERRLLGGLCHDALPAMSAAATWPTKIASGKFQGEIATKVPRPRRRSSLVSPVGPGSRTPSPNSRRPAPRSSAEKSTALAQFGERVVERLAPFRLEQVQEAPPPRFEEVGCALERRGPSAAGVRSQSRNPADAATIAASAASGRASTTRPTSCPSAGLTARRSSPACARPLMRGAAVNPFPNGERVG